jgi:hypothetical protein
VDEHRWGCTLAAVWKELVAGLYPGPVFTTGASIEEVTEVEQALGCSLPADLRDLLGESNGIEGEYGLGLIWSSTRIIADNLSARTSTSGVYMPLDHLAFFADAGNGNQFAFSVADGARLARDDVFAWNPMDDSRSWVAPDLRRYLEWWADGRITL